MLVGPLLVTSGDLTQVQEVQVGAVNSGNQVGGGRGGRKVRGGVGSGN